MRPRLRFQINNSRYQPTCIVRAHGGTESAKVVGVGFTSSSSYHHRPPPFSADLCPVHAAWRLWSLATRGARPCTALRLRKGTFRRLTRGRERRRGEGGGVDTDSSAPEQGCRAIGGPVVAAREEETRRTSECLDNLRPSDIMLRVVGQQGVRDKGLAKHLARRSAADARREGERGPGEPRKKAAVTWFRSEATDPGIDGFTGR